MAIALILCILGKGLIPGIVNQKKRNFAKFNWSLKIRQVNKPVVLKIAKMQFCVWKAKKPTKFILKRILK